MQNKMQTDATVIAMHVRRHIFAFPQRFHVPTLRILCAHNKETLSERNDALQMNPLRSFLKMLSASICL